MSNTANESGIANIIPRVTRGRAAIATVAGVAALAGFNLMRDSGEPTPVQPSTSTIEITTTIAPPSEANIGQDGVILTPDNPTTPVPAKPDNG